MKMCFCEGFVVEDFASYELGGGGGATCFEMQENLFCLVCEVGGSTSHWEKKPQRQHLTIEASFWKRKE